MAGRHAAVTAIHATRRPGGLLQPGAASAARSRCPKEGLLPLYAIPTEFGTLAPTQLVIGEASSAGTRFTLPIDTPADNSYVYDRPDLRRLTGRPSRRDATRTSRRRR